MKKQKRYYSSIFDIIALLVVCSLMIILLYNIWDSLEEKLTLLEFMENGSMYSVIIIVIVIVFVLMIKRLVTFIYQYLTNTN